MKTILLLATLILPLQMRAQNEKAFRAAFKKLAADSIFRHASMSLLVVDQRGRQLVSVHPQMGLAPASCQKVITATTAFELLGHDFTYGTTLGYTGSLAGDTLKGDIIIGGSGDPSLGSWRYPATTEDTVINEFSSAIRQAGIHEITGHVYAGESLWKSEVTPGGWIWEDIGNYYGAGARSLDWRENQYDLHLRSGSHVGDSVKIAGTTPAYIAGLALRSDATAAAKGSGDNSYLFIPQYTQWGMLRGTIPVDEDSFTVSGSMPLPGQQLAITLESSIKHIPPEPIDSSYPAAPSYSSPHIFYTHHSPTLDSLAYWFLQRSINLYGEALLKTLAFRYCGNGSTDSGVQVIQRFWKSRGIDAYAMNIQDGSGLSPANRVTTSVLVRVLQYARSRPWFASFYKALPVINGIKMKSGSIGGVVSYSGYVQSASGTTYTFSFIINNFEGDANVVRRKMWALLDLLK